LRKKNFAEKFENRERGGMLCPRRDFYEKSAMMECNDIIQVLSGLETHRSNEWEGSHGEEKRLIHASRDYDDGDSMFSITLKKD